MGCLAVLMAFTAVYAFVSLAMAVGGFGNLLIIIGVIFAVLCIWAF